MKGAKKNHWFWKARRRMLVTGAGAGIGRAIAIEFAGEGASILAADVNIEAAGKP